MVLEIYEIVGLSLSFLLSGFFSGSEAVLMSISVDRAKQIIDAGGKKALAMKFLLESQNDILSTILVGNNITNIFVASLNTTIAARVFESDVVGISVGITTIVILIFGEILPKTFARTHAEKLSYPVIKILQFFYYLLFPIVKTMVWIIDKVLGENAEIAGRLITKDEIEYMVNRAEKEKTMDSKQLDLLSSILEFPKIKVKDIMVQRSKVKFIRIDQSFGDIIRYIREDSHSRYPVVEGDLDNPVGFLHVKDLAFIRGEEKRNFKLQDRIKEPFFVYEHMKIQSVFDHMNKKKLHLALVKDENSLVVGIITLEDIVEEIVGEIQDEHDNEENLEELIEDGVTIEGSILLRDLHNDYEIDIPLNDNYSTLTGFLLDMLGNNFPSEGQIIVWKRYSFKVDKVENAEIKLVTITHVDGEQHLFSKREAHEF